MIQGSLVAIVTPMHEDGSLDIPTLRNLIDWHIDEGTNGIVIVGTTGESPTVTPEEHIHLIEVAAQQVNKRVPLLAGTGANSTQEAIALTKEAKRIGVDASLQVSPYYNRPTQEGMYQHFKAVAEAVDLPMILYNVPSRTNVDMSNELIVRLSKVNHIIGIKEASGNLAKDIDLFRMLPKGFITLSGDDATTMPFILSGGDGVISVTANAAPRLMAQMCAAAKAGHIAQAIEINNRLMSLHTKLFVEANPIPVKWVLAQMGKIKNVLRLPLVPMSAQYEETLRLAMKEAGI